ncbi:hypothetical protein GIX45_25940 [Erwinia sp. CPCC 100877]|nr:hypothetical protein [Erwinia sp. CPCC 100877]
MKLNKLFFLAIISSLALPLLAFTSNNFDYYDYYNNKASYNGQFIITDNAILEEEKSNELNKEQLRQKFNDWDEVNRNLTIKKGNITYKLESAITKEKSIECTYSKNE